MVWSVKMLYSQPEGNRALQESMIGDSDKAGFLHDYRQLHIFPIVPRGLIDQYSRKWKRLASSPAGGFFPLSDCSDSGSASSDGYAWAIARLHIVFLAPKAVGTDFGARLADVHCGSKRGLGTERVELASDRYAGKTIMAMLLAAAMLLLEFVSSVASQPIVDKVVVIQATSRDTVIGDSGTCVRQRDGNGVQCIGHVSNGNKVRYRNIAFPSAPSSMQVVHAGTFDGILNIIFGNLVKDSGTLAASCTTRATGSWEKWDTSTFTVARMKSQKKVDVWIEFGGGGSRGVGVGSFAEFIFYCPLSAAASRQKAAAK